MFTFLFRKTSAPKVRRRTNRFRPQLDPLETRCVLSNSVSISGGVLHIHGDANQNRVQLQHDGNGHVTGLIDSLFKSLRRDRIAIDQPGVKKVVVDTKGGNDVVTFTQTANLRRNFEVVANTGDGNDTFTATLNGDILAGKTMLVTGNGSGGANSMTVNLVNDVDVKAGAALRINLQGGDNPFDVVNQDILSVAYQGKLDGVLDVDEFGLFGDDTLSTVRTLDAGSTGKVGDVAAFGTSVQVGGFNSDLMTFKVCDNSGGTAAVSAAQDGTDDLVITEFPGVKDQGFHTTNVRASHLECNNVVECP
jgi:hypothetical protein